MRVCHFYNSEDDSFRKGGVLAFFFAVFRISCLQPTIHHPAVQEVSKYSLLKLKYTHPTQGRNRAPESGFSSLWSTGGYSEDGPFSPPRASQDGAADPSPSSWHHISRGISTPLIILRSLVLTCYLRVRGSGGCLPGANNKLWLGSVV